MKAKPLLSAGIMIGITGLLLFTYNNCQPIGDYESPSVGGGGSSAAQLDNPNVIISAGEAAFFNKVLVQFQTVQNCTNCHNAPRFVKPPNVFGPLTIFNYANMRARMVAEPTSTDNFIINRMMGTLAHTGGSRCAIVTQSPCREIIEWVNLEFPLKADGLTGAVVNVSALGAVNGWAIDPANPNTPIQVHIYDGPVGAGNLIQTVTANEAGLGLIDGYYFNIQLPDIYRDGQSRNLYIYGITAVAGNLLPNMPHAYAAYIPKAQAFFTNNVRPQLVNQCNACHGNGLDYMSQWFNLVYPRPNMGGSATNNWIVLKGSGQQNHSGGNRCGGVNAGACGAVQNWWNQEFN